MASVLPAILALAAVDAINPTSITGAVYLAGSGQIARLRLFIVGVYATYLSIGLAITLGPAAALRSALGAKTAALAPIVEIAAGGLLVAIGIRAWRRRGHARRRRALSVPTSRRSGLGLGFLATLADLPTAAPLLVATTLLAGLNWSAQVAGLLLYNVIYTSPLIAIALAHAGAARTAGSAARRRRLAPAIAALCVTVGAIISCEGIVALL